MLILTVNVDGNLQRYTFNKEIILIGKAPYPEVDISLPNEQIQEKHIKIFRQEDRYIVLNFTNDPFATINGLPFGKKKLIANDCIQLGSTSIFIDQIASSYSLTDVTMKSDQPSEEIDDLKIERDLLESLLEEEIEQGTARVDSLQKPQIESEFTPEVPIEKSFLEEEISKEEELEKDLHNKGISSHSVQYENRFSPSNHKDSVEETDALSEEKENSSNTGLKKRKLLFVLSLAMVLILFFVGLISYEIINDRSDENRLIAAEGIADVAMALTYAQVNHIKPQKQDWMDPTFLTENLFSILSSEYHSLASIDKQGQFRNCPYLLRVYFSQDLSQFVVIAQPNPSLLQWVVSKASLILDSQSMEIRLLKDLKTINRLLVSSNTLDPTNASEIIESIKQGALIPLSSLGTKKGFAPPKALALSKSGAENKVYNAPRYYHFGESLLNEAMRIVNIPENSHELHRLQNQMNNLSKFPQFVLYSSQGLHHAIQAQKALGVVSPNNTFLIAYLNFNNKGLVASSHLLFDHTTNSHSKEKIIENENGKKEEEMISYVSPLFTETETFASANSANPALLPLMEELQNLKLEREQALRSISIEIENLFAANNKNLINDFETRCLELFEKYKKADSVINQEIVTRVDELRNEFSGVSEREFQNHLRDSELHHILHNTKKKIYPTPPGSSKETFHFFEKIHQLFSRDRDLFFPILPKARI